MKKIDELIIMELEEDEITACKEWIAQIREEKRLAAKRERAKQDIINAAYTMAEVTDIDTTKHFLRELARTLPSN